VQHYAALLDPAMGASFKTNSGASSSWWKSIFK
jgi:hypothetical protein